MQRTFENSAISFFTFPIQPCVVGPVATECGAGTGCAIVSSLRQTLSDRGISIPVLSPQIQAKVWTRVQC